jgi:hypothetical protein
MARLREIFAALLISSLLMSPVWGAPASSLGMVIAADRAHVGMAVASVGTTIFDGDRLSTDLQGSVQMRAKSARLLLSSNSAATLADDAGVPSATLSLGTATFSTANSKAFAVHVASAVIRPKSDEPTIGQVTVLSKKELVVKSKRGALTITVGDDSRVIPEGAAYRVVLEAPESAMNAEPQGARGAGAKEYGRPPLVAAKSRFMWFAITATAVMTWIAVDEALESPDRP